MAYMLHKILMNGKFMYFIGSLSSMCLRDGTGVVYNALLMMVTVTFVCLTMLLKAIFERAP